MESSSSTLVQARGQRETKVGGVERVALSTAAVARREKVPDDSPFLLVRNLHRDYEVSHAAGVLGESWLVSACEVLRGFSTEISPYFWQEWYVKPFCSLVAHLAEVAKTHEVPFAQWSADEGNWRAALDSYRNALIETSKHQPQRLIQLADYILVALSSRSVLPQGSALLERRSSRFREKLEVRVAPCKPDEPPSKNAQIAAWKQYFTPCEPLGGKFMNKVAQVVAEDCANRTNRAAAAQSCRTVRDFFVYVLERRGAAEDSTLYRALRSNHAGTVPAEDWEVLVDGWRERVKARLTPQGRKPSPLTVLNAIGRLRSMWELLAAEHLVVPLEIKGLPGARASRVGKPRPALSQLHTGVEVPSKVQAFVDKFSPEERAPALAFVRALCADIGAEAARKLTSDGLANAIIQMNDRRLATIRMCAERCFLCWRKHWEKGQQLLGICEYSPAQIGALLDPARTTGRERMRRATQLFADPAPDDALANLLAYTMHLTQGRTNDPPGAINTFCKVQGGRLQVQAYMHPHHQIPLSLCLLLLVDSGANVEVVRASPFHCWGAGGDRGQREVRFGVKNRAGGKRITDYLDVLPQKGQLISSIQALEQYIEMTHPMRKLAPANVAAKLFLCFDKYGEVTSFEAWRLFEPLRQFIEENPELHPFRFAASSIRVSVLLSEHFHHPNGLEAAQVRGDHASAITTNRSYTGSLPVHLVYDQMMREFMDRFQAMVVVTIDGSAAKLGISKEAFEWLVSDAARTGLGFACLNPKAGIQPGTTPGKQCTEFQNCAECSVRWVVATADNIADMILTNEHLRRQQAELSEESMDIWEKQWLPTLAFTEVALKRMQLGDTAPVFAQGKKLADERRPTYTPFPFMV